MKINQPMPRYIRSGAAQTKRRSHLIELPWAETSGHPASPYKYNNMAHAAVHSILAGLRAPNKKNARYWLETAQRQLNDAVAAVRKPKAKLVPCREVKR